jgi:predicted O-methyltransferase YrrM
MPAFLVRALRVRVESFVLDRVNRQGCNPAFLKSRSDIALKEVFTCPESDRAWDALVVDISEFDIPDGTGGVNPGDRRAIYYLLKTLKPFSVLEIGTHIGASTLHIAAALASNSGDSDTREPYLASVDIADVNNPVSKPWLRHGMKYSPIEMLKRMNLDNFVDFVQSPSLEYFSSCERKFDFIFLDGSHSAKSVYLEIPAALNLLNKGGVILLHDYFLGLKPLWSNGVVIPGPYLATERLKSEGANLEVMPLGELPWPTKLQSNVTSLALLLNNT